MVASRSPRSMAAAVAAEPRRHLEVAAGLKGPCVIAVTCFHQIGSRAVDAQMSSLRLCRCCLTSAWEPVLQSLTAPQPHLPPGANCVGSHASV